MLRISATDFAEGPEKNDKGEWVQWGIEQSKIFTAEAAKLGVDLIDVSAGGNWSKQVKRVVSVVWFGCSWHG
jgi:hypothetical protein